MYLLDTDICIAIIRRKPQRVLERLTQQPPGTVAISSVSVAELNYSVAKSAKPEQNAAALEQFLLPLELRDFDQGAAQAYGVIRAFLEQQGISIGALDMLIAAHALSANLVLVTHNVGEFGRVPNLQIEDWLAAPSA